MFSMWDDKISLNVFQSIRELTPDKDPKLTFTKTIKNIVLKFKDRIPDSEQKYINMFPQAAVKMAYEATEFFFSEDQPASTIQPNSHKIYKKEFGDNIFGIQENSKNPEQFQLFYKIDNIKKNLLCDRLDVKILLDFIKDFAFMLCTDIRDYREANTSYTNGNSESTNNEDFNVDDDFGF